MKTRLYSMAVIAMMICAGLSSCSKDDSSDEGGSGSTSGKEKGHEYVDLGLPSGTKWATCNVGASVPEGFGYYFAWGETKQKSEYTEDNYKWNSGEWPNFTKYCNAEGNGTVDNKTTLEMSDDAARANWGGKWRMATYEEWQELLKYCTRQEEDLNDIRVSKLIGPNGKYIYLPEAGFMSSDDRRTGRYWYWTSSIKDGSNCSVWTLLGSSMDNSRDDRYRGLSVRAVIGK